MSNDTFAQAEYWDRVAGNKTFTHPVEDAWLQKYFSPDANIVDYGCGYGRLTVHLIQMGYNDVKGFDTSAAMIRRGKAENNLPLYHLEQPGTLPVDDESVDGILLFAVLTCIPSNDDQVSLMQMLERKLAPGGVIYLSDYFLQDTEKDKSRYTSLDNNPENYGVFHLPEGAVLRHHKREWIEKLVSNFFLVETRDAEVLTMNGNKSMAFQMILKKGF